jgi:hypothetical protein
MLASAVQAQPYDRTIDSKSAMSYPGRRYACVAGLLGGRIRACDVGRGRCEALHDRICRVTGGCRNAQAAWCRGSRRGLRTCADVRTLGAAEPADVRSGKRE